MTNRSVTSLLAGAVLAFFAHVPASIAGEAEVKAAQTVIDSQIKAFLSDNNAAAYSHAAPSIKQIFPTVDQFMDMVRRGYKPVWKPQSYTFGKSAEIDDRQIMQQVFTTGPDGIRYEAIYTLRLQDDGGYKITGVRLRKAVDAGA
ncbi:MAG: DUF4864 domain-containing protein [Rhizobiaceae bacterium]